MRRKNPLLSTAALRRLLSIENPDVFRLAHHDLLGTFGRITNESDPLHVASACDEQAKAFAAKIVCFYSENREQSAHIDITNAVEAFAAAIKELARFINERN